MQDQTKQIIGDRNRRIERAIVLQTLREDRGDGRRRADLAVELGDADPTAIGEALTQLGNEGVIELAGEIVRASRAAIRLSDLEMIAV
jgi:hypothetical protein